MILAAVVALGRNQNQHLLRDRVGTRRITGRRIVSDWLWRSLSELGENAVVTRLMLSAPISGSAGAVTALLGSGGGVSAGTSFFLVGFAIDERVQTRLGTLQFRGQ